MNRYSFMFALGRGGRSRSSSRSSRSRSRSRSRRRRSSSRSRSPRSRSKSRGGRSKSKSKSPKSRSRSKSKWVAAFNWLPFLHSDYYGWELIFTYNFPSFKVIATCQNQKAVVAVVATAAPAAHAHDHMIAIVAVHCPSQRTVTHDQAHQKIMAAPVARQTEMKAWMIRMGTLTPATLLLS